jgi:hypothetical protein
MSDETKTKNSEELAKIIDASLEAGRRGDKAEEMRLLREIPLEPELALAALRVYGKERLLRTGCDLSEANEALGAGWLDGR